MSGGVRGVRAAGERDSNPRRGRGAYSNKGKVSHGRETLARTGFVDHGGSRSVRLSEQPSDPQQFLHGQRAKME